MDSPAGLPWNPLKLVPPGTPHPGLAATVAAWNWLITVFTDILPSAFTELRSVITR